ncbi:hypothetical protein [Bradyrhizobium symbiodeficiens]|uniref:Uncharacterized protein n=2 Tax=Bradyrhizobium symbiodeficiens TaxID=1404367 RepID=A0ABZ2F198_9BRAD|nr:hypothetical protein [Bradyrhizobium symbiodeficiens]
MPKIATLIRTHPDFTDSRKSPQSDSCLLLTGGHHDDDPDLDWRGIMGRVQRGGCGSPPLRRATGEGRGFRPHRPPSSSSGLSVMQIALVKRQPKRRCRIPRRPHPSLDYFFGRFERTDRTLDDDAGLDTTDLDHCFPSQRRH